MEFLKKILANIIGTLVTIMVLSFIFMIVVVIIAKSTSDVKQIKDNSVLHIKLDKQIEDKVPSMPFNLEQLTGEQKLGLNNIVRAIEKAKTDEKIKGVYLEITLMQMGMATMEEIREALLDFKKSGKFIIAYGNIIPQLSYYLSTVADKIYINEHGYFMITGLKAQSAFFKGTLQKLDIEPYVIRAGSYKSAGERFVRDSYSSENKVQLSRYIGSAWSNLLENIHQERNIQTDQVNKIADSLLLKKPEDGVMFGLVDSLAYEKDVLALLKKKTGIQQGDDLKLVSLGEYIRSTANNKQLEDMIEDESIAVIYASGTIVDGDESVDNIAAEQYEGIIREVRSDSSVKAVVLRINSPGGSAIASENLWYELNETKKIKPIIVSMGDVAASGGYYIACMADTILAQPYTITGSVGVIGMYADMSGFFNKLGITFDEVKTNEHANLLSGLEEPTQEELAYFKESINRMYTVFLNRVAEGRGMTLNQVDSIAQGQIWSGKDALNIGLIDKIGGLQEAISIAERMAGIGDNVNIKEYPQEKNPLEQIFSGISSYASSNLIINELGIGQEDIKEMKDLVNQMGVVSVMPYKIEVE